MVTSSEQTQATGIRREIEVGSPPEDVWEALVDDDERGAWFGGPSTLDPRPGGRGWFEDADGRRRTATVEQAEPGRRLAWTWWPEVDDSGDTGSGDTGSGDTGSGDTGSGDTASRVQIDLTPVPGGTRVAVTEIPLTPVARASALTGARGPLVDLELRIMLRSRTAVVLARA